MNNLHILLNTSKPFFSQRGHKNRALNSGTDLTSWSSFFEQENTENVTKFKTLSCVMCADDKKTRQNVLNRFVVCVR